MELLAPQFIATFSPNGGTAARLKGIIDASKISLDVMMYELCSATLATALAAASRRMVRVRVIADGPSAAHPSSQVSVVRDSLAVVKLAHQFHIFHDKVLIADAKSVTTGSYNWTIEAEIGNAENCLTLENTPEIIAAYQADFDQKWMSMS